MLRPVLAIVVLAALGAVSLIGAAPAPAAYPGANGELVFTSTQDGGARHIFVTNGAGGIRDLTGVHASTQETQPEFSPSGTKIAFTRGVADSMNTQIFVMNANGTNRVALTHTSNGNGDPTWSPDGNHIAFVSDRAGGQGDIYVMNADGTHVRRLTHDTWSESDLAWSPSGRIAFVRVRPGGGDEDIWSIKPDGTGLVNLSHDSANDDVQPDWSPNGKQIVYAGPFHPTGSVGGDLWIMNANGTNQHPLQHESNGYSDGTFPAWSPNGQTIAFVANNGTGHPGVWKVPATGGQNIQVVNNNGGGNPLDQEVDWQPVP
jgi:Tol biopolymer transport system component